MKFANVVESISTVYALKRIASAHVVDYGRLGEEDLRANILRTMNQYTHPQEVESALDQALHLNPELDHRVLAELIITDVLLNEYGHLLPSDELSQKVLETEQAILNESNEKTLGDLAGGKKGSPYYDNLALYQFVLSVAWEHRDTKSVDEANLLRRLRQKLTITRREHRLLEAMLGKYPKDHNDIHTKTEIHEAVKQLERLGLIFEVRDEEGKDFVVIPEEIVGVIKNLLGVEIRKPAYRELVQYKAVRRKAYLRQALKKSGIPCSPHAKRTDLQERVIETVPPSVLLGGHSPRDGLNNDDLREWCSDLGLQVTGKKAERIERIIGHYDQLQVKLHEEKDEREIWYHFFAELATRDAETLRNQHIIDKDLDIEHCFEEATSYLFDTKLNHTPLRQAGTKHPDGLLSFRDNYIMWDNKSCEGPVRLKDHMRQFDEYMDRSEKPVPVFLVIAPDFDETSDALALEYTARNIGRNICLIRAEELKEIAELWASEENDRRSDPFPLGLFARAGRFSLQSVRASLT